MRRIRGIALSLAILLASGCDGGDDRVVLRVWDWWSPVEGEKMRAYFEEVEQAYERSHPDVDVRFQHIPFGPQYIQKIMASMAAGRPPDVLHASAIWANDLYERGVLSDMRTFVNQTPEMADSVWLPSARKFGREDEHIYGIPIELDASALVYNLDLFEEAGIPTDPLALKTWDDLRRAAKAMTRYDDKGKVVRAGFMLAGSDIYSVLPWFYSNGGKFYSEDRRQVAFNSPEMVEAMTFLRDLQHVDRVSFPIATERQDLRFFMQGEVAIFPGGTWTGHIIEEQAPSLRFQLTSFPKGPRGVGRGGLTWTNQMCIPKGVERPDLAWEFVTFYCGMDNALWKLKTVERNSPLAATYEMPEWRDAVRDHPSLGQILEIAKVGGPRPMVRNTEISDVFRPLLEGFMINRLSAQEVLDQAEAKVNQILDRYYSELEEAYR